MNETPNKIDRYSMIVISKYFNCIRDYINIEKCCKEYNGIIEQFKFNPIPISNKKEREMFKNIETYCFYQKQRNNQQKSGFSLFFGFGNEQDINEEEKKIITKDERIKKYIYWEPVSYSYWKRNKRGKEEFKGIEYGKDDMNKYLFGHAKGKGNDRKIYLKTEKVELEEGITSIGDNCFEYCINLKEINIPSSVYEIGEGCFRKCSNLSTITIRSSVSEIGRCCFHLCKNLSAINIPTSVSYIRDSCFNSCFNLSTINIPSSVSTIGYECFWGCKNLSTINISTSVKYIGDWCFSNCYNLSTIDIPTNVKYIGSYCFGFCINLNSVSIPSSVFSIGKRCFFNCDKLKGNISIDPNNSTFRTDGTKIFSKDNNEEVYVWK